jgi:hypothetical protein
MEHCASAEGAVADTLPGHVSENRKRVRLQLTVNPKTDARLGLLAERFTTNKGRLVDKLVECLAASYAQGVAALRERAAV